MSHIWSKPFISQRILLYLIFLAAPTNQKWSDIHCKSYSSRQNIRFGWRSIFCWTPVLKDIWYANDLTRIIIDSFPTESCNISSSWQHHIEDVATSVAKVIRPDKTFVLDDAAFFVRRLYWRTSGMQMI